MERLEQMLQVKDKRQEAESPQLNVRQLNTASERRPEAQPATAFPTGTLIHSTSGHVRFLPSTSGWRIVDQASQQGPFSSHESAITDTPSGPYPFGEHNVENRPNLIALLPPTEYCDQLKDGYFLSFAPLFPILHRPTFNERYRLFSNDSDQASLGWLALLFSILGTAVLALEHDSPLLKALSRQATPWDQVTELSERYYTAAMKCLEADRYLWRHNIWTLQTLLNMIYGIHHSHGQTWTLLGLVYHLALSIGCHVDPAAFSLENTDAEQRRRCWLGLTTLLCNQNMTITGFDIYQSVFSSSVLPPTELWDEEIVHGQPAPIQASVEIKPVSYLIQKSHLFQISSEICNPALATRPKDSAALHRLDAAIRAKIDLFEQSYASLLGTNSSVVHLNLLLSFSHHLILLLHSIMVSERSFGLPRYSWSRQRCMESAKRVLELHVDFHQLPQFTPFYWYVRGRGAFHAFHAAFVLLLILATEPQEPRTTDMVRLLHGCHARLESSKAQSQMCTRTATILGRILSGNWVSASGLVPGGLDTSPCTAVSQGPALDAQPDHVNRTANFSNFQAFTSESVDFPSLVRSIEPQQWIDPGTMDWDQWDLIVNSLGTTS